MSEPRDIQDRDIPDRDLDDRDLVAFLDRETTTAETARIEQALAGDATLRDRLAALDRGGARAQATLASMIDEAPEARLAALLDQALRGAVVAASPVPARPVRSRFMRLELIAATVAIFILGGVVGGLMSAGRDQNSAENWRQAVAEYWTLTTPETLAIAPPPSLASAQMAAAGSRLGLDLQADAGKLRDLAFRGAELFDFHGAPLVQMAYLDPTYGPIAYCIIADPSRANLPKTSEMLDGFNIVHWAKDGHARLLIGRAPIATLTDYAERLDG